MSVGMFLLRVVLFAAVFASLSDAFTIGGTTTVIARNTDTAVASGCCSRSLTVVYAAETGELDPSEVVARRITVKGNVGGYYRQCVVNEAGRFRRLVGTMSPPDGSDQAEIYVEGKRKLVDGFLRWCQKSDVGLSQVVKVVQVVDEEPTGLYEGFYAKVRDT